MSSIGTGYDQSADQFSPDGRIFQIEYALKAVENSSTAIGIKCKDGVVLAVEKLIVSKLHENDSNQRIYNIDRHVGMAISGFLADARALVEVARNEASSFRSEYGVPVPVKFLTQRLSNYMHNYTLYGQARPFGVSILLSSYLDGKAEMYMIDPSGVSWGYNGCAIGKARQAAKTEIEKLNFKDITCREAIKEAAKIVHLVHDEVKDKAFELQVSWVGEESVEIHQHIPQNLKAEAEDYAKEAMEDSDSDED